MSSPGPDIVLKCPHCGRLARRGTFRTISFMGHSEWSDGYHSSTPSMGTQVAKCSGCLGSYWVDSAEIVDQAANLFDPDASARLRREWQHVAYLVEPNEKQYYQAIARGDLTASGPLERAARLRAWWRRNDPARHPGQNRDHETWTDAGRANLETLISLFYRADENPLLQAEGYRELGDFRQARTTLGRVNSEEALETKERLLGFCEARNTEVQLLSSSNSFR